MGWFVLRRKMLSRPQEADQRADVFGLGMTALFCLYREETPERCFSEPKTPHRGSRTAKLQKVIAKALEWDPGNRFNDIGPFLQPVRGNRPARPMAGRATETPSGSHLLTIAQHIVEVRGSGGQQRSCSSSYWVSQVSYWYDGRVNFVEDTNPVQSPSPQAPCSKRARAVARWPRPLPRLRVLLHRCKNPDPVHGRGRGQTIPCSRARSRPLRRYPLNRSRRLRARPSKDRANLQQECRRDLQSPLWNV